MINRLICFALLLLFANTLKSQTSWALDVFPLKVGTNVAFGVNPKLAIGVDAEFGLNLSNYILAAGPHFAEDITLITPGGRDSYDNEAYWAPLGIGLFARLRNDKRFPIDLGWRAEVFIHSDESSNNLGGGIFNGIYTKFFLPTNFKTKGEKIKRRMSIGGRISLGTFKESDLREAGVMVDVWARFYLNYSKKSDTDELKFESEFSDSNFKNDDEG